MKNFNLKFKSLLVLCAVLLLGSSQAWGTEYSFINNSTGKYTSYFFTGRAESNLQSSSLSIKGLSCSYYVKMNGTGAPGVPNTDRYIQYDVKSTSTTLTVYFYNNNSSSDRSIKVGEFKEGNLTGETVREKSIAKKTADTLIYSTTNTGNSTIYITVPSNNGDVLFYQVVANETGNALPKAGEGGYELSFNKGRFTTTSSTTAKIDGITIYSLGSGHTAGSTTSIALPSKVGGYIYFTTPSSPGKLKITYSGGALAYNSSASADGATAIESGTEYALSGSSEYYIVNTAKSGASITKLEFIPVAPTFSEDAGAELTGETDAVTLTSAGNTIYYKWSTESDDYDADDGSTLAGAADGSGTSPVDATAPNGTGTYYLYAVAKKGTLYSDVVKRNYTIEASSVDHWYVYGNFSDGETWTETEVEMDGNVNINIPMDAHDYSFKIKHTRGASTWYSGVGDGSYMSRDNHTSWNFNNTYNCGLRTDIGGTYNFALTLSGETPVVTVTYPTGVAVTLDYNYSSLTYSWQAISGEPMPTPPTPSRDGYAFDGWYTTSAGTTPFDFETPITSATTIYAKWSHAWYYAEEDDKWVNHVMTRSDGESYWYRAADKKAGTRQFKIQNNANWYGYAKSSPGYNCTNWTNMNNSSNSFGLADGRAGVYNNDCNYYIIVFPPYSPGNTSENPIICASTTLPEDYYSVPSGRTIYFDNSEVKWSNVYFRKGRDKCTHNEATAMSKVTGTENLYELTTDADYDGYQAFQIANNTSWTGNGNSIYLVNGSGYAITGSTEFQKYALDKDMTFTPGDEGDLTDGCQYYETTHTSGMKKDNVSITTPSNGTITVAYTSGGGGSITSGDVDLAHTSILTISASGNTGYELGTLTVNGASHTSGEDYTLSEDAVVAATFTPKVYSVTFHTNSGTINSGNVENYTYGVGATLPTDVTRSGYLFAGWYANSSLTGDPVTTIANNTTDAKEYWAKWTALSSKCQTMNDDFEEAGPAGYKTINGVEYDIDAESLSTSNGAYLMTEAQHEAAKDGHDYDNYMYMSIGDRGVIKEIKITVKDIGDANDDAKGIQYKFYEEPIVGYVSPGAMTTTRYSIGATETFSVRPSSGNNVAFGLRPAGTSIKIESICIYYVPTTYTLTKGSPSNGTVAVTDGSSAITSSAVGETVYITATPSNGYSFSSWDVYKTGESSTKVSLTDNDNEGSFTMPAYGVTVDAAFECTTPTFGTNLSTSEIVKCKDDAKPKLTVAASANSGDISYQWYKNTENSTSSPTPTALTDSTKATMCPPTSAAGKLYYFCKATNTTDECTTYAYSNITPVTVTAPTAISSQPTNVTDGVVGSASSLSVTATGTGTLTYQWYSCKSDGTSASAISSATNASAITATLSITPGTVGTTYYKCVVHSDCGSDQTSNVASILAKNGISPTLTYASSVTYGSTISPSTSGTWGDGSVTYSLNSVSPAGSLTINSSTGVVSGVTAGGTATVTATIDDGTNYWGGSITSSTITVAKADLSVSPAAGTASSVTQSSATLPFTLESTTGVASVTLNIYLASDDSFVKSVTGATAATSGSGNVTGLDAETTYYFTVTPIGDSNHNNGSESSASETFTTEEAPSLSALEDGTLYKPQDIFGTTAPGSDTYVDDVSYNGKFEFIGSASSSTSMKWKSYSETTINSETFTATMYFGSSATLSSKIPTNYAMKFILPTAGTLTIYYRDNNTGGQKVKLAKSGADPCWQSANAKTSEGYATTDELSAGTYYLYATSGSTAIFGIQYDASCTALSTTPGTGSATVTGKTTATLPYTLTSTSNVASVTIKVYEGSTLRQTFASQTATTSGTCSATGLSAGTTYTYTVTPIGNTGYCDGDESSKSSSFTTQYSVTYADGGKDGGGAAPTDSNGYEEDAKVTVLGNVNTMTKTGYTFRGWTNGNKFYKAGDKFEMPAENVTLTAVWENTSGVATEYIIPVQKNNSTSLSPSPSNAWVCDNGWLTRAFGGGSTSSTADDSYSSVSSYNGGSNANAWMFGTTYGGSKVRIYLKGTNNNTTISAVYYSASYFSATKDATAWVVSTNYTIKYYNKSGTEIDDIDSGVDGYAELTLVSPMADGSCMYFTTSVNTKPYAVSVFSAADMNFDVTFANGSTAPSTYHWTELPSKIEGVPSGKKIVEPATEPEAVGYDFGGWYKEAACTNEWDFDDDAVTSDKTLYAKWTTNVRHFIGAKSSAMNDADNYEEGELPNRNSIVYVMAPVEIVANETEHVGRVIIVTGGKYTPEGGDEMDCTGKIDISYDAALIVKTYVKRCEDGADLGTLTNTKVDDIHIGSLATYPGHGNGALITVEHNGTNKAAVDFATVSHYAEEYADLINQFVGTPFNDRSPVINNYYYSWVCKPSYDFLDGTLRPDGPTWDLMKSDEGMAPFIGYNLISYNAAGHVYNMSGTLVETGNQDLTLKPKYYNYSDARENLLANSWTAPIKIGAFKSDDFRNADPVIYIFNAGSPNQIADAASGADPLSVAENSNSLPGQYTSIPINLSSFYTHYATIPSMQSFSVLVDVDKDGETPSLHLDYKRLVYDPAADGIELEPNHAPRRQAIEGAEGEERLEMMKLYINGESGYMDRIWMVVREDFSAGYDAGWEARKLAGLEEAPQVYTIRENGNMCIDAVDDLEGTVIGFHKGAIDNNYTFSFKYDGDEEYYLNDLKEQTSTLINNENTYVFTAETEDAVARFIISETPIHKTPTDISPTDGKQDAKVRKVLIDNHVYIIRGGRMYNATGALVK